MTKDLRKDCICPPVSQCVLLLYFYNNNGNYCRAPRERRPIEQNSVHIPKTVCENVKMFEIGVSYCDYNIVK